MKVPKLELNVERLHNPNLRYRDYSISYKEDGVFSTRREFTISVDNFSETAVCQIDGMLYEIEYNTTIESVADLIWIMDNCLEDVIAPVPRVA